MLTGFALAFLGMLPAGPMKELTVINQEKQLQALWISIAGGSVVATLAVISARQGVSRFWLWFVIAFGITSILPSITDAVTIDGTTQAGWVAGTFLPIVIDGNNGSNFGFRFSNTSDGSTMRGLVVRDFDDDVIDIASGADNITITGNFIGQFNADGTDAGDGGCPVADHRGPVLRPSHSPQLRCWRVLMA